MNKRLKKIIAAILCIIAIIWTIPTIYVQTTISQIKDYEVIQSTDKLDTYQITFTYERDGQTYEGTYTDQYGKDFAPLIGEQGVCHYLTIPPHPVFIGDPPSPVMPLALLAVGLLLYICDISKFLKKKEQKQDEL